MTIDLIDYGDIMNKIKMYKLIKEVYDDLEHLVIPVVREDVRSERNKLLEVLEILEND